jgi:hypothetical protein
MSAPPPSQKDGQQVLKYAFDDASGKLRVNATISPSGTDLEIHHEDDSIAIGTPTELFTATDVGPKVALDVNVAQTVLPPGAATSALQTTGNTSLASIDTKLTSPLTINLPPGASTSALQTTGNTSLASIDSKLTSPLTVTVNNFPATQAVTQSTSPWVVSGTVIANAGTNLNTSALALESGGHLASIDTKLTAPLTTTSPTLDLILDNTTTANVTYIGQAVIGSVTSAAVWQIKKMDETTGLVLTWANSTASFSQIWDNRASLPYG